MEDIKLDKESFKALASETRVSILKSLTRRRKTMTELSKELGMAVPTIKEHLASLGKAGLVKQIDDGHKWKYFELTRKGKEIADPGQKSVWIVLLVSLFAFSYTLFDFTRPAAKFAAETASDTIARVPALGTGITGSETIPAAVQAAPFSIHIPLMIVFAVIAAVTAGFIIKRHIQ